MADVKVYEHNTLVAAMKERAKQYEELEKQITALKKEFDTIVKMDDELQGNGAKSIKGFYGAQGELADAWLRLIGANIAFFNGVSGSAEESKLSGDTIVVEPFLEDEVSNGLKKSKEIVTAQQDDLKKIFHTIDDILSLQVFSKETFEDEIDKADKKRENTIKAVNKFDANLLTEYAVSEQQENYLIRLLGTIMNSSSQGGKISPMSFDSQAYKNSDVYKLMDDVKKANSDYLTFKKDQAKARKQAKELEEQENRPWYEKAWDTTKTFTGEITGYYDYIRATEGVDPVTHEKLTTAQRAAAAAMAAAGFIPVVGWAGRAAKGGVAIYRTAKVLNAADHALDAYKTTKGFAALQKTEKGLYALAAANGMGEGITGRDFLGNKLTEEQKQQSLIQAFSILGLGAAGKFIGGKPANIPFNTYSKQYAQATAKNVQNTLREIGKQIGKVDVPVGAKVLKMATNGPIQPKILAVETKTLSEVKQGLAKKKEQKQVNKELGSGGAGDSRIDYLRNKYGKFTSKELNYRINLRGETLKELQKLKDTGISKKKIGPAFAGVYDKTTGKIHYAINDYDGILPDFHPFIKSRYDSMPQEVIDSYAFTKGAGSHAEVIALNKALQANPSAGLDNFVINVIRTGQNRTKSAGMMFLRCPHCAYLTDEFEIITEVSKNVK
ncbi:Pre-toxin TG [Bacillus sp. OV322]|uniref:T7SS effector LXG polymorphic toxin n=1 Tax=Bacillus sp. OV322 TaxID=1882764 RepID=UPI0008E9A374|nr:T7SS effector LXG polymorphic toxin [Bacillus sp. OV322]SFC55612.1 Pre-toxin TG [Bacillus sp. OV322]